jgi:hypothetical protein
MAHRLVAVVYLVAFSMALAWPPVHAAAQLKCETGPVPKTFGATAWLVYSCDDGYSVVVISAAENPAMPFYFMFNREGTAYRLSGEGTGRRETTAAAFEDLKRLSTAEVEALVAQTRVAPPR